MATQNKEQARQLLLAKPQLLKALFQVFIYCIPLGIVVFSWHFLSVPVSTMHMCPSMYVVSITECCIFSPDEPLFLSCFKRQ